MKPVIQISVQRMVCTKCGAEANASCRCGEPYVPKSIRAAKAIATNPQKSDRAIAADIGVNQSTVSRARKSTDADASVGDDKPRIGRDGKTRRMPVHSAPDEDKNDDDEG